VKRRLRKKKHLGEFVHWGCWLSVTCRPGLGNDGFERLLERWWGMCEVLGCEQCAAAWPSSYWEALVVFPSRALTSTDMESLTRWLQAQPEIIDYRLSDPVDAFYFDYDSMDTDWSPDHGSFSWIRFPARKRPASLRAFKAWLIRDIEHFGPPAQRMRVIEGGNLRPSPEASD